MQPTIRIVPLTVQQAILAGDKNLLSIYGTHGNLAKQRKKEIKRVARIAFLMDGVAEKLHQGNEDICPID
jgi:hypothetical protein